jgi:ribosomal protein S18 acetylase RimI-like enzyme
MIADDGDRLPRLMVATPDDARAYRAGLMDLLRATVGDGAPLGFLHPLSEDDARVYWDDVFASLARGERVLVVALDRARVVGAVQLELAAKQNAGHRAEVQKLTVLPDYRGHGTGRLLMERIEAEARRAGRTLLVLDTREGGYAEQFYERLGWHRSGRIPGYVRDERGMPHATIVFHKSFDDAS